MGQFVSLIAGVGFLQESTVMKLCKSAKRLDDDTPIPCRRVRIRPAEVRFPTRRRYIGAPIGVAPYQKPSFRVSEEQYADYPGLESAMKSHDKFPKFLRKLTISNLNDKNKMRLEIPWAFVKKHGDELQERVTLLERGGHPRQVGLEVTTSGKQCRVYFSRGWRNLFLQKGCRKGDVLVFFLVGASTFVVRKFSRVPNRE